MSVWSPAGARQMDAGLPKPANPYGEVRPAAFQKQLHRGNLCEADNRSHSRRFRAQTTCLKRRTEPAAKRRSFILGKDSICFHPADKRVIAVFQSVCCMRPCFHLIVLSFCFVHTGSEAVFSKFILPVTKRKKLLRLIPYPF